MFRKQISKWKPCLVYLQETKLKGIDSAFISRLNFPFHINWCAIDSEGNFDGMLMIWNSELFSFSGSTTGSRWICIKGILIQSSYLYAATNVYAFNDHITRADLWSELSNCISLLNCLALVMGDFNEVLYPEDGKNCTITSSSMCQFQHFISNNTLIEYPSQVKLTLGLIHLQQAELIEFLLRGIGSSLFHLWSWRLFPSLSQITPH